MGDLPPTGPIGFGRSQLPVTRAELRELSVCTIRGVYPQTRVLTDGEAARMLAGEPLELERVRLSPADKVELGVV